MFGKTSGGTKIIPILRCKAFRMGAALCLGLLLHLTLNVSARRLDGKGPSALAPQPIGDGQFQTRFYSQARDGNYPCSVFLEHLSQELGGATEALIAFTNFIGVLEHPDVRSDKDAIMSIRMLNPMSDEFVPHETWLKLLYTCTVGMPQGTSAANLQQAAPQTYRILRATDSVLQRIVKLGMARTLQALLKKGLYEEGHFFHSRDQESNNLFHLAVLGRSSAAATQLANVLGNKSILLLDGVNSKNSSGLRPWDLAKRVLEYNLMDSLNRLYEVYRDDHPNAPAKVKEYKLPDIRVIENAGGTGGGGMGSSGAGGMGSGGAGGMGSSGAGGMGSGGAGGMGSGGAGGMGSGGAGGMGSGGDPNIVLPPGFHTGDLDARRPLPPAGGGGVGGGALGGGVGGGALGGGAGALGSKGVGGIDGGYDVASLDVDRQVEDGIIDDYAQHAHGASYAWIATLVVVGLFIVVWVAVCMISQLMKARKAKSG